MKATFRDTNMWPPSCRSSGGSGLRRSILNLAPAHSAPRIGSLANDAAEHAGEVRLVAQPAAQRNRAQWFTGRDHQALRHLDAPACEIFMSGSAERAAKGAAEVAFAQIYQLRQLLNANPSGEVSIDVGCQTPLLPGRQAAAHDFPRTPVKRAQICRYRAGLPAKQCDRAGDVGLGGLAVTIARKAGGFHEPRG